MIEAKAVKPTQEQTERLNTFLDMVAEHFNDEQLEYDEAFSFTLNLLINVLITTSERLGQQAAQAAIGAALEVLITLGKAKDTEHLKAIANAQADAADWVADGRKPS